ncbi:meiosis protein 5 [Monosporozyma unispora]
MSSNNSIELESTTLVEVSSTEISQSTPKKSNKVEKKPFKIPFKKKQVSFIQNGINKPEVTNLFQNYLKNPLNSVSREGYSLNDRELKEALKLLNNFDKEIRTKKLIQKWRNITQGVMSYILNMTLCKIDRIGGYEELRKKELKLQKKRLEYMLDDSMQDEVDNVFESEEFNQLPVDDQEEYKRVMEEKLKDFESHKAKELKKLEDEINSSANKEMDMEELAKRLKVSYPLVFPSEDKLSNEDLE